MAPENGSLEDEFALMYIFRGYVGFREGNTTRHSLRSISARALGTRQAKSFCVELPVQLHGRLYDLGQHCPHRTNVEWPSGEVHFANFAFVLCETSCFKCKTSSSNQPTTCGFKTRSNEWDFCIQRKKITRRTREWSFQRIPVWTLRVGAISGTKRWNGWWFFLVMIQQKKSGYLVKWLDLSDSSSEKSEVTIQYNSVFFHSSFGLQKSSQISTLNLKGFPCSSSCQVIRRLEERLPWFVCEAPRVESEAKGFQGSHGVTCFFCWLSKFHRWCKFCSGNNTWHTW